ncbi:MAG: cytochrome c maturation protein CcmE [Myxococcota bacterium]
MNQENQRRFFMMVALMVCVGAIGTIASGSLGKNIVYYLTPSELVAKGDDAIGANIRLAGVVVADSKEWNEESRELTFEVSDPESTVKVYNIGAPPQMFREGIGVVVEGTMDRDGVFRSEKLMVKHSNEYKAPEDGVAAEELYRTVEKL